MSTTAPNPVVVYVKSKGNGLAIAGFVTGLVGVVFGMIPLTYPVALAGGFVGLTLAAIGWRHVHKDRERGHKRLAIVGTVVSVLAITLGVVGAVIVTQATNKLQHDLNSLSTTYPGSSTP